MENANVLLKTFGINIFMKTLIGVALFVREFFTKKVFNQFSSVTGFKKSEWRITKLLEE